MKEYFWTIFFLDLIVPVIMLVAGRWMWKKPPQQINPVIGFRTVESMQSQEAWLAANTYAGKIWWIVGWIMLGASAGIQLFFLGATTPKTLLLLCLFLSLGQVVVLVLTIIPVQRMLKKHRF